MTKEEAATILIDDGWERSGMTWYTFRKWIGKTAWYASLGSVPHLPCDRPFAVYIHRSGEFGENYLTTRTLEDKLKQIKNK